MKIVIEIMIGLVIGFVIGLIFGCMIKRKLADQIQIAGDNSTQVQSKNDSIT